MSPSSVEPDGSVRKRSWKRLKFGSPGTSSISDFTRCANAACAGAPPSFRLASIFLEISTSTRSRLATSLRVLLMLVCSRTELREVLLSWMSYSAARMPLNCVPS